MMTTMNERSLIVVQHQLCPVDMGYLTMNALTCMGVVGLSGIVPFFSWPVSVNVYEQKKKKKGHIVCMQAC